MANPPTFKDLQRLRKATREPEVLPTRLNPSSFKCRIKISS